MPSLKAKGKAKGSFFADREIEPYAARGVVLGQSQPDSCVATVCRMLILDVRPELREDIDFSETFLRHLLETDEEGALVRDIPRVLCTAGINDYVYRDNLSWTDLLPLVQAGNVVVRVAGATPESGHVLIVEEIAAGRVAVRDSLPKQQGSSYWVKEKEFRAAWLSPKTGYGKAVFRVQ